MKELSERALDMAKIKGASYADIRLVYRKVQSIEVKSGEVEALVDRVSQGFGIRVIANGAWGFAASSRLDSKEAERMASLAVEIAQSSAGQRKVNIGAASRVVDKYQTPIRIDPFAIPWEEKLGLLLRACEEMQRVKGITTAEAGARIQREEKLFASTEGSFIEQQLTQTGCSIRAKASGEGEFQYRSYPDSMGCYASQGWEFVESQDLVAKAPRIAEEAVALLTAKQCPSGVKTIILDGGQLALQVHESCGHAIELDRALGTEASYAGTSFLTTEKLGSFKFGSEVVNITADATLPGGLGSFGYDDEGIPAQGIPIVQGGIFRGYLTSRETASSMGWVSNGAMRADGWRRFPLIRMTNINLEPGDWEFDDLLADTDEGVYMRTNKSWSIDDKRLNFQFGTEIAWEIKKGKLGAMLKNATYTGMTPQFWASCDAVCDRNHWFCWGIANCAKGQPVQTVGVGHAVAPARFRNVQVGVI